MKILKREPIANACGIGERIEWVAENGTKYISFIKKGTK